MQSQADARGWVDPFEAPSPQSVTQVLRGNYKAKDAADLRRIETALQDLEEEYVAKPHETHARHDRREFLEGLHSKPVTLRPNGERGTIVSLELADYEGSGGSEFYLLSETGTKLVDTFGQRLSVASRLTNGHYDLMLDTGSAAEPAHNQWKWDGAQYRESASSAPPPAVPAAAENQAYAALPNSYVNDARTYSVSLIAAAPDISAGTELLAQGRVASFGYAGARSRPFVVIEDEQQPGKMLFCGMMADEGAEVISLYRQGELVQVAGEYMGTFGLADRVGVSSFELKNASGLRDPSTPLLSNCTVAGPTDKVVLPSPR
jgi:hypothetical protein